MASHERSGQLYSRWSGNANLSASIAVYRPQAELFGGRSDGKSVVRLGKASQFQSLKSAGDHRVGVTRPRRFPSLARCAEHVNPEFMGKTGRNPLGYLQRLEKRCDRPDSHCVRGAHIATIPVTGKAQRPVIARALAGSRSPVTGIFETASPISARSSKVSSTAVDPIFSSSR